ncbi:hypothetical protein GCM10018793_65340 [Streptomyces sulfonofaciens]|uniref:Uncharacterized protein n=1 Tax=Streptomyces sulfonofaciens TaxID=68272 RepID=A0A919GQ70_9ACTN|nr:hypothetical protein GCM10018793_65340 [Streptomyces sulfonofaciens]
MHPAVVVRDHILRPIGNRTRTSRHARAGHRTRTSCRGRPADPIGIGHRSRTRTGRRAGPCARAGGPCPRAGPCGRHSVLPLLVFLTVPVRRTRPRRTRRRAKSHIFHLAEAAPTTATGLLESAAAAASQAENNRNKEGWTS